MAFLYALFAAAGLAFALRSRFGGMLLAIAGTAFLCRQAWALLYAPWNATLSWWYMRGLWAVFALVTILVAIRDVFGSHPQAKVILWRAIAATLRFLLFLRTKVERLTLLERVAALLLLLGLATRFLFYASTLGGRLAAMNWWSGIALAWFVLAFSLGFLSLSGRRWPLAMVVFVLLLAQGWANGPIAVIVHPFSRGFDRWTRPRDILLVVVETAAVLCAIGGLAWAARRRGPAIVGLTVSGIQLRRVALASAAVALALWVLLVIAAAIFARAPTPGAYMAMVMVMPGPIAAVLAHAFLTCFISILLARGLHALSVLDGMIATLAVALAISAFGLVASGSGSTRGPFVSWMGTYATLMTAIPLGWNLFVSLLAAATYAVLAWLDKRSRGARLQAA